MMVENKTQQYSFRSYVSNKKKCNSYLYNFKEHVSKEPSQWVKSLKKQSIGVYFLQHGTII